jgi:CUB domain
MQTSQLLRKICMPSSITPITSTGSLLRVHFHSDNITYPDEQGFEIAFTESAGTKIFVMNPRNTYVALGIEGCGGVWTTPLGEITSPNYPQSYSGNLHCEYLIQLPINERIRIQFKDLNIESAEGCLYDYLEVNRFSLNTNCSKALSRDIVCFV